MQNLTEKKRKKHIYASRVLAWLVVMAMALFVLATLMIAFFTALKTPKETISANFRLLPEKWLWTNFIDVLTSDIWGRYFFNSLFITITVVILSILLSSLAGYAFARLQFK